jgi:D-alanine-D-alanine ligase
MHEHSIYNNEGFGRVAVLMGGNSAEREISLMSGQAVLASLLRSGVDATGIDVTSRALPQALQDKTFDRVMIMLHGRYGEDGKVQGELDALGLSYTGSGVAASALAMDKIETKKVWLEQGLSTPAFAELDENTDWQSVIDELGTVFVKPVNEGSSIGISPANNADALQAAYAHARRYDDKVIAEQFIDGPEYTIGILGERVLPVVGMKAASTFYDYDAKYFSNETRYFCPCDLDANAEKALGNMAKRAYDAVGCSGWGRVDAMRDANGTFWLLEVNTVPGMTEHSLVPMAAKGAGIGFDDLVLAILASSTDRAGS